MGSLSRNIIFFLVVLILGLIILLPGINDGKVNFTIRVITYVNVILFITSLICVTQFFWPKEINRTPFHVFNLLFAIIFYSVSLNFLISHKDFYEGYSHLSDMDAIKRFSLRWDVFSFLFWFILFAAVLNVIYILRHRQSYLQYN
ncbi:MAG: hypothetical protein JWQ38_2139 [Flavipsychrobacter sp.]|nr:hypothetical protein [Flavipsychrobacter sp.]